MSEENTSVSVKTPQLERLSGADYLKNKIREIKPKLPTNWKEILILNYPEYNSMEGADLVRDVMLFRSSDAYLTQRLEDISKMPHVE